MQGQNPRAGWYPDPQGSGLRYWDGTRWTEHIDQRGPSVHAATPQASPIPANPTSPQPFAPGATSAPARAVADRSPGLLLVLGGAALMFLVSFLPWATSAADDGTGMSDSVAMNAWDGRVPWALFGPDLDDHTEALEECIAGLQSGRIRPDEGCGDPSGTSDVILVMLMVAGAAGLSVLLMQQRGKPRHVDVIIVLGALSALLILWQVSSINSTIDGLPDRFAEYQVYVEVSGGPAAGLWLGLLGALAVVAGGVKHRLDVGRSGQ